VTFRPSHSGVCGRYLSDEWIRLENRPPDQLLHWHIKQGVLKHTRGTGEPNFDQDFPPGSDMVGEILSGPRGPERMEFELFSRFAALGMLQQTSDR
jgi:hypothetical protein